MRCNTMPRRGALTLTIGILSSLFFLASAGASAANTVTVQGAGTGEGTVTSTNGTPHLNCTIATGVASGICASEIGTFSALKTTATATVGSEFAGWSYTGQGSTTCAGTTSPCNTVFLGSGESGVLTATFDVAVSRVPLMIDFGGTGSGTVKCDTGSGPEACAVEYPEGTTVTVIDTAASNSEFVEWLGECDSVSANECEVTMSAAKTIEAINDLKPVPPGVRNLVVSSIAETSVHLAAEVNSGIAASETEWQLQYSTADTGPWTSAATGMLTADNTYHSVEADAVGLAPDAHYYARITASNEAGAVASTPVAFETLGPPTAETASVHYITSGGGIRVFGSLDPHGFDTHYYFEYGQTMAYGESRPVPAADAGAGAEPLGVSADLADLEPGAVYHYRLTAESAAGGEAVVHGQDQTLVAPGPNREEAAPVCPNAPLRSGYGGYLPECRAYEMVSPPEKNGGQIVSLDEISFPASGVSSEEVILLGGPEGRVIQAAPDGTSITYASLAAPPEAQGAQWASQLLSTRTASGWVAQSLVPPGTNSGSFNPTGHSSLYRAFSESLSTGLLCGCGAPNGNPPIPGTEAPAGEYANIYLRDNAGGSYRALLATTPSESAKTFRFEFESATSSLGHIAVATKTALAPGAVAGGTNRYIWSNGEYQLFDVLPGEAGPDSSFQHLGSSIISSHAISEDGSRVFWQRGPGSVKVGGENLHEELMMRDLATETTSRLDASQVGGHGGGGQFMFATPDGSVAYFTAPAAAELTADTVPGSGANLYRYEIEAPEGERLTDLTPSSNAGVAGVVAASQDGSYVYFAAKSQLAPGSSPGSCLPPGDAGSGGTCNLYLLHGGTITFIATLSEGTDLQDWVSFRNGSPLSTQGHTARVMPDGHQLVFMSARSLTGYDNTDTATGKPDSEVYFYDATTDGLVCASCNPTGSPPIGPSRIPWATKYEKGGAAYESRVLSADGSRVFFDSADSLVPRDTNGKVDVYEWRPEGAGACQQAVGCVHLISSGTSSSRSLFVDASTDGRDVFFVTAQQLLGRDADQFADLYDARIDGGFPEPPLAVLCDGEGCRGSGTSSPGGASAASGAFNGPGNVKGRSCPAAQRRAPKLRRRASVLRRRAKRAASPVRARRLRHQASRLSKQATKAQRTRERCLNASGRAPK